MLPATEAKGHRWKKMFSSTLSSFMTFSKSLTKTLHAITHDSLTVIGDHEVRRSGHYATMTTPCASTRASKSFFRDPRGRLTQFFAEFRLIFSRQADRNLGRGFLHSFLAQTTYLTGSFKEDRKELEEGDSCQNCCFMMNLCFMMFHDDLMHWPALYGCRKAFSGLIFKNMVCTF